MIKVHGNVMLIRNYDLYLTNCYLLSISRYLVRIDTTRLQLMGDGRGLNIELNISNVVGVAAY